MYYFFFLEVWKNESIHYRIPITSEPPRHSYISMIRIVVILGPDRGVRVDLPDLNIRRRLCVRLSQAPFLNERHCTFSSMTISHDFGLGKNDANS